MHVPDAVVRIHYLLIDIDRAVRRAQLVTVTFGISEPVVFELCADAATLTLGVIADVLSGENVSH
jgi:hypothetical protein